MPVPLGDCFQTRALFGRFHVPERVCAPLIAGIRSENWEREKRLTIEPPDRLSRPVLLEITSLWRSTLEDSNFDEWFAVASHFRNLLPGAPLRVVSPFEGEVSLVCVIFCNRMSLIVSTCVIQRFGIYRSTHQHHRTYLTKIHLTYFSIAGRKVCAVVLIASEVDVTQNASSYSFEMLRKEGSTCEANRMKLWIASIDGYEV